MFIENCHFKILFPRTVDVKFGDAFYTTIKILRSHGHKLIHFGKNIIAKLL